MGKYPSIFISFALSGDDSNKDETRLLLQPLTKKHKTSNMHESGIKKSLIFYKSVFGSSNKKLTKSNKKIEGKYL